MQQMKETLKKRNALGLGLDALIPLSMDEHEGNVVQTKMLSVESIRPNKNQPRQSFNNQELNELAVSLKEIGLIQPIIVRSLGDSSYEIVAGERRWRAAIIAKLDRIPVIIREVNDKESLEIALIENLQREDLNPLETAEGYQMLIQKFSYTHEILASRIGKDRTDITNHLRLLKLPEAIKSRMKNRELSMGHARTLLAVDHIETQLSLSEKTIKRKLSVRELERIVQNFKQKKNRNEKIFKTDIDSNEDRLEKALSRHLSTKVTIKKKTLGSGKIELHFYSEEQLMRILETLGFSPELA